MSVVALFENQDSPLDKANYVAFQTSDQMFDLSSAVKSPLNNISTFQSEVYSMNNNITVQDMKDQEHAFRKKCVNMSSDDEWKYFCTDNRTTEDIELFYYVVPEEIHHGHGDTACCHTCNKPLCFVNGVKQSLTHYVFRPQTTKWLTNLSQFTCHNCRTFFLYAWREYVFMNNGYYRMTVHATNESTFEKAKSMEEKRWRVPNIPTLKKDFPALCNKDEYWFGKCVCCHGTLVSVFEKGMANARGKSSLYGDFGCRKCMLKITTEENDD